MLAHPVWLDIEGETMKDLVFQMRMQLRVHIRTREGVQSQPISAYAENCTFADVRDALEDLFHLRLSCRMNVESLLFTLDEDPHALRAAMTAGKPKPGKGGPRPVSPLDPELLKPVSFPKDMRPLSDVLPALPAIQRRLAKATGIRICSDYTGRTEQILKGVSADAFCRSLDGLPLRAALDKIAARFGYTWRKSRGWYLFQSRTWQIDRQERLADQDETIGRTPRIQP
jgi:hypothetical protein